MGDIIDRAEMVLRRRYELAASEAHALLIRVSEQQCRSIDSVAHTVIERLAPVVAAETGASGP
ncbi:MULTISPECIES: ANTAR domain-containing protein [unclassified Mycobacterium]|uniref:ANTAR domain-containing protein n=1 Tax=unclassified Mycobacterium TaxID=2642494 RepID=UPI0006DC6557|nr:MULTISPECIES: ANTAR domain-containing protein [unclassified Mycobacterium]